MRTVQGAGRRWRGVRLAAGVLAGAVVAGAAASGCASREPDPAMARRIAGITRDALRGHVEALAGGGPRASNDAAATARTVAYLEGRLRAYGYEVVEETFRARSRWGGGGRGLGPEAPRQQRNLLAVRRGTRFPDKVVELGAHYDSVPRAPGADDNASGVAALLEVARVAASMEFARTIRFCLFAMEEDGVVGSEHHARAVLAREGAGGEEHLGILVLECIGFTSREPGSQGTPLRIPLLFSPPTTGNFLLVVGNLRSGGIGGRFERAARAYVPDLPLFSMNRIGGLFRDAARSDHAPYWRAGLLGVMVTDTANFRNPNYHRRTDVGRTLDYVFLERVARAAAATIMEWAVPVPSRSGSTRE